MGDPRRVQHQPVDAPRQLVSTGERGSGRQLDDVDEVALILLRDETGGRPAELEDGEADKTGIDHHHDQGHANETTGQLAIAEGQPFEGAIETPEEGVDRSDENVLALRMRLVRLE